MCILSGALQEAFEALNAWPPLLPILGPIESSSTARNSRVHLQGATWRRSASCCCCAAAWACASCAAAAGRDVGGHVGGGLRVGGDLLRGGLAASVVVRVPGGHRVVAAHRACLSVSIPLIGRGWCLQQHPPLSTQLMCASTCRARQTVRGAERIRTHGQHARAHLNARPTGQSGDARWAGDPAEQLWKLTAEVPDKTNYYNAKERRP